MDFSNTNGLSKGLLRCEAKFFVFDLLRCKISGRFNSCSCFRHTLDTIPFFVHHAQTLLRVWVKTFYLKTPLKHLKIMAANRSYFASLVAKLKNVFQSKSYLCFLCEYFMKTYVGCAFIVYQRNEKLVFLQIIGITKKCRSLLVSVFYLSLCTCHIFKNCL